MTGFSAMSQEGREQSAAVTKGRRKVVADRIEYGDPEGPDHWRTRRARLLGTCGHVLRELAAVPVGYPDPAYLADKLGRRMTCQHDDCRVP